MKSDCLNNSHISGRVHVGKIIFRILTIGFFAVVFSFFMIPMGQVQAGEICFCHGSNNPHTICTDQQGEQNGHTNHGDPDFGCMCGDGTCDPNDPEFETPETCPQDCEGPPPPTCGDGNQDNGEQCGEEGLACSEGETCTNCRCVPPTGECFTDEDCDDGVACNGQEVCLNTRVCADGTPLDTDGDGINDCDDPCPENPNNTPGCQGSRPLIPPGQDLTGASCALHSSGENMERDRMIANLGILLLMGLPVFTMGVLVHKARKK